MKNRTILSNIDFLLSDAILFVTGLIICFFNIHLVRGASRVIGMITVILGLCLMYLYFSRPKIEHSPFFIGLICILIGGFMAIKPDAILSILPIIVGLIVTLGSIMQLKKTWILKKFQDPRFPFVLVFNLIFLIIGLSLFLNPIQSLSNIIKIVGIIMVFYSLYSLLGAILANQYLS
ncbi:MAG: DUF308 domain-containing protein [Floccifex sp.]